MTSLTAIAVNIVLGCITPGEVEGIANDILSATGITGNPIGNLLVTELEKPEVGSVLIGILEGWAKKTNTTIDDAIVFRLREIFGLAESAG